MESGLGTVGRDPTAIAVRETGRSADGRHRLRGLGCGSGDRRSSDPRQNQRSRRDRGISPRSGLRAGGIQGAKPDLSGMGRADAPADPDRRAPPFGFGVAAERVPSPRVGTRHARDRSSGEPMQALIPLSLGLALIVSPGRADTVYVSNEQDNTVSVVDGASLSVVATIPVGRRPRGIALSGDK